MKNIPEKIYLQIDADGETPEDFNELVGVSWCIEKINANDIEFTFYEANKICLCSKPAWLETLWNVNPRLAEAAEKDF